MKFILTDFHFDKSSYIENIIDNQIFKSLAFTSKFKEPSLSYYNVLIPLYENLSETDQFILEKMKLESATRFYSQENIENKNIFKSIYKLFEDENISIHTLKSFLINVFNIIDSSSIGVSYTDGSASKNVDAASYACCKLLEPSEDGLLDEITGQKFLFESFSGKISDGTNNIGELTGIKTAINNLSDKNYQIIISDSIYGIKTYREYIHVWKNNGYRAYNKKEIKNKQLIIDTFEEIKNAQQNKKIFFKWTKGHANNQFNDECDKLAKQELGI